MFMSWPDLMFLACRRRVNAHRQTYLDYTLALTLEKLIKSKSAGKFNCVLLCYIYIYATKGSSINYVTLLAECLDVPMSFTYHIND